MILCYHAVDPDWTSPLAVTPSDFAMQCAWLARHRRVGHLEALLPRATDRGRLPRGTAAVTFDDGFASLREHALPVLVRCGIPSIVYLVAGTLVGGGRPVDWIDPAPATPPATLTLDEVREMQDAGVRFGSHTMTHPDLTTLDDAECLQELGRSREALEDLLGVHITSLAYPKGRQTPRIQRLAQRAGYTSAVSLAGIPDSCGPMAVARVGVYPGDGPRAMRIKTTGAYLHARRSTVFPRLRSLVLRRSYRPDWRPPAGR